MLTRRKTWIEDEEEQSEENVLDGFGSGYFPALTPCSVQLLLDNTRCLPTTSHSKHQTGTNRILEGNQQNMNEGTSKNI